MPRIKNGKEIYTLICYRPSESLFLEDSGVRAKHGSFVLKMQRKYGTIDLGTVNIILFFVLLKILRIAL